MLKELREFVKAAHLCGTQCFNANQETQHKHKYLFEAYKRFDSAWDALPMWFRKWALRA